MSGGRPRSRPWTTAARSVRHADTTCSGRCSSTCSRIGWVCESTITCSTSGAACRVDGVYPYCCRATTTGSSRSGGRSRTASITSSVGMRSESRRRGSPTVTTSSCRASSGRFDFLLAQSIFSHATQDQIRTCLSEAAAVGGVLAATYFPGPADSDEKQWSHLVRYRPDLAIDRGGVRPGDGGERLVPPDPEVGRVHTSGRELERLVLVGHLERRRGRLPRFSFIGATGFEPATARPPAEGG